MRKTYSILLCILLFATGCSSYQSPTMGEEQQNTISNTYEIITKAYQENQENLSSHTSFSVWEWVKKIATADALAAAAYVSKNGMESDWKEALIVGATASVEAALSGNSSKTNAQATTYSKPYQALVLSEVQQIKSVAYDRNFMNDLGYQHYILVNEVLKDPTLSQFSSNESQEVMYGKIYDKVYDQAQKLGLQATYDKQEAIALLSKIENTVEGNNNQYYAQLFTFKNQKDKTDFKTIASLYTSAFNKIKSAIIFTDYSKEMEAAVLQDNQLSQEVKEILLLQMATYRFGYTYYSATF